MNRKLILTCLLLLTLMLAACGNDPTPTTTAPTATTGAPAATATTAIEATSTTASAEATSTTADAAPTGTTGTTNDATATASTGASEDTTPRVVAAAEAFLATLNDTEKSDVMFDWTDDAQKARWSNLPQGGFSRDGLMWGNLSEASQTAWLALMSTTLSPEGYQRVMNEWNADQVLADSSSGQGGGGLQFGKIYYWIAIIGAPSTTDPWMWQWGGHHVTVNATVVGPNISITPSFIGVQPATYTDSNGKTIRPLGDIDDTASALLKSLDKNQQSKAVLGTSSIDLVLGIGQDGKTIASEGLPGSEMTQDQQAMLLQLVGYYVNILNSEDAVAKLDTVRANLAQTYFAWYGSTTNTASGYFRITGPTVVIEYSPQQMGGNAANHIHGIYRDPTNEYGSGDIK